MPGALLLQAACLQPCQKAVEELLEHGAKYHDNSGAMIMNACRGGEPMIVQSILERCQVNIAFLRDEVRSAIVSQFVDLI